MAKTAPSEDPDFLASVKAGEHVFHEGDPGSDLFIVQEGQVELLKGERRLALLQKGDFFGELALLERKPRDTTARAVQDCRLLKIDAATFDQLIRKSPEVAVLMMRRLARRLHRSEEDLATGAGPKAPVPTSGSATAAPVQARLVYGQTGPEFTLPPDTETVVGRADRASGFVPDVDLSAIEGLPAEARRSVSRRHAKIWRKNHTFHLREEPGVANGTVVNGERLQTGVTVKLKDGDEISFGLVKATFHLA